MFVCEAVQWEEFGAPYSPYAPTYHGPGGTHAKGPTDWWGPAGVQPLSLSLSRARARARSLSLLLSLARSLTRSLARSLAGKVISRIETRAHRIIRVPEVQGEPLQVLYSARSHSPSPSQFTTPS